MNTAFYPGQRIELAGPLSIFLPPYSGGSATYFLRKYAEGSEQVIDPFGQSPWPALELVRDGAGVLVGCLNPIQRFLTDLHANPPDSELVASTLALIRTARRSGGEGSARARSVAAEPHREEETVEESLRALYQTSCASCGQAVEADSFVWSLPDSLEDHPAESLVGISEHHRLTLREYHCPRCGREAVDPVTPEDERLVAPYLSRGLYFHLALERLAPPDHPDRMHAVEALRVYPLRSLYALFLILTRMESLNLSAKQRRCGEGLLLAVLDQAHVLRGHPPSARLRPRSLQVPAHYREINIWRAFERAGDYWAHVQGSVPLVPWKPGEPLQSGVLSLFAGSARDLVMALPQSPHSIVISLLPRPNQALWTLSAMWAGWLWGPESVAPLRGMLHRRRYDWAWHARALRSSIEALTARLQPGAAVISILGESEPGFLAASAWAFERGGLDLEGMALRPDIGICQMIWRIPGRAPSVPRSVGSVSFEPFMAKVRQCAFQLVLDRSEPSPWEVLQAEAWREAAAHHLLPPVEPKEEDAHFSRCQAVVAEAVETHPQIAAARGEESELGNTWWIHDPSLAGIPLSDRVEAEVRRVLAVEPPIASERLDAMVCTLFPGMLTPEARLLRACLRSYAKEDPSTQLWSLREEDQTERRVEELETVRSSLGMLGNRLGYTVTGVNPLEWRDSRDEVRYRYGVLTSCAFSHFLLDPRLDPQASWIVLPGGRSSLVEYKMRRNWLIRHAVENGWRFLKFRHVRRLLADTMLSRETIDQRLGLDPLGKVDSQISFL